MLASPCCLRDRDWSVKGSVFYIVRLAIHQTYNTQATKKVMTIKEKDLAFDLDASRQQKISWMMSAHLSAHIPFNAVHNLEYRRFLRSISHGQFGIPSRSKLQRGLKKEYQKAIEQLTALFPKDTRVSIALDGWTAAHRVAILSIIAYHIDRNWNLVKSQLGFEQVKGRTPADNARYTTDG